MDAVAPAGCGSVRLQKLFPLIGPVKHACDLNAVSRPRAEGRHRSRIAVYSTVDWSPPPSVALKRVPVLNPAVRISIVDRSAASSCSRQRGQPRRIFSRKHWQRPILRSRGILPSLGKLRMLAWKLTKRRPTDSCWLTTRNTGNESDASPRTGIITADSNSEAVASRATSACGLVPLVLGPY